MNNDLPQSRGIHAAVAFVLGATCVPLLESSLVPTSSASFTAATATLPVGRPQMLVSRLTQENFEEQMISTLIFVVLFLDGSDRQSCSIVERLEHVAEGFRTGIGFGFVDVTSPGNDQLGLDHDVAITPLLAFYRSESAIDADIVGYPNIMRELTRENLLAMFGRTRSGAVLIK